MPKIWKVALLTLACMFSCSHESLDKEIRKAVRDGVVNFQEWKELAEYAKGEKKCCVNDELDPSLLQEYILHFIKEKKIRSIEQITFEGVPDTSISQRNQMPIKFKFFLERSGSMIPFDDPSTTGQFKAAISGLLNSIPDDPQMENLMYVVNDAVYPYKQTFKDFLQSKDIFKDTKGVGDPRYTDFTCIFDSVLTRTQAGEFSILVSDLIYSTKDMESTNRIKILNEAQSLSNSVFRGHTDKDVLVAKFMADYRGKYYPYNSPSQGYYYQGDRPFYMVMVAEPDVMRRFFKDKAYRDCAHLQHLNGFKNFYCFTNHTETPYYSILLNDKHNKGRFAAVKGSGRTIHAIHNIKKDREGELVITVAVDLSDIITQTDYLEDVGNYDVESTSQFAINEIVRIGKSEQTPHLAKYAPQATHLITLTTTEDVLNETLRIKLINAFPRWIDESNSDDDTLQNGEDFPSTTFAFSHLMKGIYDSYFTSTGKAYYFDLEISINK